ncbi:hypothetical protein GYMLUDRAFT_151826, partial [Collybiopsis luxurians FD-317 M1]
ERIGAETGCWLYLAAQHPGVREPFVHFTSPRLINDYIPIPDTLHETAHKMFVSLHSTCCYDAAELAANLQVSQENEAALKAENEWLQEEWAQLDKELELKNELIRRLQALHGH